MPPERDSHGYPSLKRRAEDKVNSSTSRKRLRHVPKKVTPRPKDARVHIGPSFDNWCKLKETHGFHSHPEVAEFLINTMKRSNMTSGSPEATKVKTKSEVRMMIQQEIQRAVAVKEQKLQDLMENIQQLNEVDFENSIQKLEARINIICKRAETALSYIRNTQKKSLLPSLVNVDIIRANPGETTMDTVGKKSDEKMSDCTATSGQLVKMMENAEKALKRISADRDALMAIVADTSTERPPPVLSPEVSVEHMTCTVAVLNREESPPVLLPSGFTELMERKPIKQEPEDDQDTKKDKMFEQFEPNAKRVKEEVLSPEPYSSGPNIKEERLYYPPPLPTISVPSILSIEAASYSTPRKLEIKLAFIKNPTRLSVMWGVKEEDPSDPPMESYTVFLTMEKVKGSGIFQDWDTYDKLEAKTLPMCALIKKYKPGHKVCAAVVGKDIFGRFGPYSDIFTAVIPD